MSLANRRSNVRLTSGNSFTRISCNQNRREWALCGGQVGFLPFLVNVSSQLSSLLSFPPPLLSSIPLPLPPLPRLPCGLLHPSELHPAVSAAPSFETRRFLHCFFLGCHWFSFSWLFVCHTFFHSSSGGMSPVDSTALRAVSWLTLPLLRRAR